MIGKTLQETGLDPSCLDLEITESYAMQNADFTISVLRDLKKMGVRVSIDDFGTGYSSLSYLKQFPIDTLKIDRSFVNQMIENEENIEIVRTIVSLAQNLNMDVVAEGVETKEQLALLRQLNCENGQGFFFSNPLEASEVDHYVTDFSMKNEDSPNQLGQLVKTLSGWPVESIVNPQCLLAAAP